MIELLTIDKATGEPYIIHKNAHAVGGVEGATLVEVTEEEFAEKVKEHPLHKDRPMRKGKPDKKVGRK